MMLLGLTDRGYSQANGEDGCPEPGQESGVQPLAAAGVGPHRLCAAPALWSASPPPSPFASHSVSPRAPADFSPAWAERKCSAPLRRLAL